jgi:hypothetical protein
VLQVDLREPWHASSVSWGDGRGGAWLAETQEAGVVREGRGRAAPRPLVQMRRDGGPVGSESSVPDPKPAPLHAGALRSGPLPPLAHDAEKGPGALHAGESQQREKAHR